MLRLIITLAVCMTLASCKREDSTSANNLGQSGKDSVTTDPDAEEAISCYICNSLEQDGCDDETFDKDVTHTDSYSHGHIMDCRSYFDQNMNWKKETKNSTILSLSPPADAKFFCSKTVITFEFPDKSDPPRVVRKCAYDDGRYGWAHPTGGGCYYTATPLYTTTVCKCEGKDCNSATSLASSLFVFVTGLLMLR